MTLDELLKEKLILAVINNSTGSNSTPDQIMDATLNAWHMNYKRASNANFILGIRHGIAYGCYKIEGIGIRKCDQRVFFSNRDINGNLIDLSKLVYGLDLKKIGLRKGYKEIQYINC